MRPNRIGEPRPSRVFAHPPCRESRFIAGVYSFFVVLGVVMLGAILLVGAIILWIEGRVPKKVLLLRAHSIPFSLVVHRVLSRRQVKAVLVACFSALSQSFFWTCAHVV